MGTTEQQLRDALDHYRELIAQRDELTAKANADRERAIRMAAEAGMTRRQIAQISGVSFQRVQQIIRGS